MATRFFIRLTDCGFGHYWSCHGRCRLSSTLRYRASFIVCSFTTVFRYKFVYLRLFYFIMYCVCFYCTFFYINLTCFIFLFLRQGTSKADAADAWNSHVLKGMRVLCAICNDYCLIHT